MQPLYHDAQPTTDELLDRLSRLEELSSATAPPDAPHLAVTEAFFTNSWQAAEEGLLKKTDRIRVEPSSRPAPRCFRFELDLPYVRQERSGGPVERSPGPMRGSVVYREDLMTCAAGEPVVQVRFDDRALLSPNFSRRHGIFCTGVLPPGPIDLETLLELIWLFASYQCYSVGDPADLEAAAIFATDPTVLEGLGDPAPLY